MVKNKPVPVTAQYPGVSSWTRTGTSAIYQELQDYIAEIREDLQELEAFNKVKLSRNRVQKIGEYLAQRATELEFRFVTSIFESDDQQAKVDTLLIAAFLKQRIQEYRSEWQKLDKVKPLLGDWAGGLVELVEARQTIIPVNWKDAGLSLSTACVEITRLSTELQKDSHKFAIDAFSAYRATQYLYDLHSNLQEWYDFYTGYDPMFTWWMSKPWQDLCLDITSYITTIREYLVGIKPGDEDAIVGQPLGLSGINAALESEFIAYTPEELIKIGEQQYAWCLSESIKASHAMGFGDDWLAAQEKVKNMYVPPGEQIHMVHSLAQEAITYVTSHDLITVPPIARDNWQTFMMSPARQKVNPFFLGGPSIIISYPTDTMSHSDKLMVMRGNNRPFSRSTVFHELIPGHHLQWHYMARYKTHRQLFTTPFWTEGWAFYWELILWDRGFAETPEDKLGMLFWHMHRCARIVFSLNFHLGKWTAAECVEYLVDKVGHERATAEGEVRRSFNGEYGPLYQAGYMLGALQLYALREEIVVQEKRMGEKEFHDRVMRENNLPIELLRALIRGEKLEEGHKAKWRFYNFEKGGHKG